jgi:hypothetical protein
LREQCRKRHSEWRRFGEPFRLLAPAGNLKGGLHGEKHVPMRLHLGHTAFVAFLALALIAYVVIAAVSVLET